jgi:hypothetical protein
MAKPRVLRSGKYEVFFDPGQRGGQISKGTRLAEIVAAWPAVPELLGAAGLAGTTSYDKADNPYVTYLGERRLMVGKKLRPVSLFLLQSPHYPGERGAQPELVTEGAADIDSAVAGLAEVTANGFDTGGESAPIVDQPELSRGLLRIADAVNRGGVDRIDLYSPPIVPGEQAS